MIRSVRKIPVLRYGVIIIMITALFVGTEYLYLHYQKAQLLRNNIDEVISARENSALIDSCIIKLYSSDNHSRLYTVTGNKVYLRQSADDINSVLNVVNRLKLATKDPDSDLDKLKKLIQQKAGKTNDYVRLKFKTDSLIKASKKINTSLTRIQKQIAKPVVKVEHKTIIDTVKVAPPEAPRKKFLGRVFSAFSKKKEEKPQEVVVMKDTVTYAQVIDKKAINNSKKTYTNYSANLSSANEKLRSNEQQMLLLNNDLTERIIKSLKDFKDVEQIYVEKSKSALKENLANVFWEFKRVSTVTFIFLAALLAIAFYNIWKIFRNEQLLLEYSKKAEEYAQLKGNFLAGMSHEIRTPLNSVIGFSEQLSQEDLPPAQKEQVSAIKNSSEMILDLVNEILDFSKYETGKMSFEANPFMLRQVIEEVVTTMNIHALKKGITLENLSTVDEKLCFEGDKMRLKQVLMNLIGNAIKFTVKGRVTLETSIEMTTPNKAVLKVKVIDTGLGIDKANLPHIFDEFSQVLTAQKATKHKGTGLGLAICKKIVELQGGKISVSSKIGIGSTFSFELPLVQLEDTANVIIPTIDDSLMAELVRDKHVLLAEDNKLNVLLATTILKKWGVKFDVAYNGSEALDLMAVNSYDMLLTDIEMPVMNGLELTQHVRKMTDPVKSNIIIMAMTANVLKEDRDHYFSTGVNDVILKPFLERALIEKVSLAIQNNLSAMKFMA